MMSKNKDRILEQAKKLNEQWIDEMKAQSDKIIADSKKFKNKIKTKRIVNSMFVKKIKDERDYYKASNMKWKTKDGRIIKVKDLKTDHAVNIIIYLRKHGRVPSKSYWQELNCFSSIDVMSDAEEFAFDDSLIRGTLSKLPSPAMDAVLLELKHRKVDIAKEIEKKENEEKENNDNIA